MRLIFNPYRIRPRWFPALCIAVTIFLFSSIPGKEVEQSYHSLETALQSAVPQNTTPTVTIPYPIMDWLKVGHGVGYFWLGVSVPYGLSTGRSWLPLKAFSLCSLYAATDEIHQNFVPARSAAPKDVLIDTLAALAGVVVMLGIIKLHDLYESKKEWLSIFGKKPESNC